MSAEDACHPYDEACGTGGPCRNHGGAVGAQAAEKVALTDAEREALGETDERHEYPTETDDGLVMRCRCGATPPGHLLGEQVDEAFWLWRHRQAEKHATVERIVAVRVAEAVDRERAAWATKIETLADECEGWAESHHQSAVELGYPDADDGDMDAGLADAFNHAQVRLRALLAADDTEAKA